MTRLSVRRGAARLREVVALVERGDEVELTRKGKVVAVIVPVHQPGRAGGKAAADGAAALHAQLNLLRTAPPGRGRGMPAGRADELVAALRPRRGR